MSSEPQSLTGGTSLPRFRFVRFGVSALVTMGILAAIAAHAPPRVRLIGLFPAFFGAVAGAVVASLTKQNEGTRRQAIGAAAVFVPLMLAAAAAESFRSWRELRASEMTAHLTAQPGGRAILDRLRSDEPPENDSEAQFLEAYRTRMSPSPAAYLVERLKGLPVAVTMPWAAIVAAAELLLGWSAGIAASVVVSRPSQSRLRSESPS